MKRAVLFINGSLAVNAHPEKWLLPGDLIFCADGGANHALSFGLRPHRVIGDLDSVSQQTLDKLVSDGVPIDRYPAEKDQTDLELALQKVCLEKPDLVLVIGAFGGRPDHLLANLFIFTRTEFSSFRMILMDEGIQLTFLNSARSLDINGTQGDVVSLVPLSALSEVRLEGVKWPLRCETLSLGTTRTISNELQSNRAKLQIGSGVVAVMYQGKGPGFL